MNPKGNCSRVFGQSIQNRRPSNEKGKVNIRLPPCLKKGHHNAETILDEMRRIVDKHAYLPQEKNTEFRRKYNFSCEDVKKIYFYILKSDKAQPYRSVSRSYNDCKPAAPEMMRQESMNSVMSMSDGDMSETVEFPGESISSLSDLINTEGISYDYLARIYANLKSAEQNFSNVGINILSKSPELNYSMRRILIDWLHEVAQEYSLEWQTLLLSIQISDQYLRLATVQKTNLQLVGVTALWIAAKMEEIQPPPVHDFTYISDDAYTYQEVINFESMMLKKLQWNVTIPTPLDFVSHLLLFFDNSIQLKHNTYMFVDIFLQHKEYTHFLTSKTAAAALLLSVMYSEQHDWTAEVTAYSGYSAEELLSCSRKINQAFGQALMRNKVRAAYLKHYRKHKSIIYLHKKWSSMTMPTLAI
jgi:hypothetical protein